MLKVTITIKMCYWIYYIKKMLVVTSIIENLKGEVKV